MKNDITTILQLLDKFFEAETSEQEEIHLKEYFNGEIAKELLPYKPLFQFYEIGYDDGKSLSDNFDEKLLKSIKEMDSKPKTRKMPQFLWYAGIAASLLIIAGTFFFTKTVNEKESEQYSYAIDALILISEKMDLASVDLENLSVIGSSLNQFDALKLLDEYGKNNLIQRR